MANPYFTQASQLFGQSAQPPNINQFFNPFAGAVGAQMQNLFGQQQVQNNANLVQSAGGVGADRIAIGQGNLANQQGLAAGQTFANLYQPALSAAEQEQNILQGAAYGYGALGPAAQNSVLQGAQAQLGTGNLQQQLSQAQLNAPYQNTLARLAYPFQTANFLTNSVASLAPGLGGTTAGYGTYTPAQPSIFSQIAGAGLAGAGIYGGLGGSGNSLFGSSPSYGGGSIFGGDAYGGSGSSPLPGLTAADYGVGFGPGGRVRNPYMAFDVGGAAGDAPIDIDTQSIVPTGPMARIAPHIPQLNLNAGQGSAQSGGPSLGDIAKTALQVGMMFANRGGAIRNPYADGGGAGEVDDATRAAGINALRSEMIQAGYMPDAAQGNPYRLAGSDAMNAWRQGTPMPDAGPPAAVVATQSDDDETPSSATPTAGGTPVQDGTQNVPQRNTGFADSPWLPLIAAGFGIMGGTSPFAGVNIGQGGLQGIKALEAQKASAQKDTTIDQEAQKLAEEARQHQFAETQMTPYQQALVDAKGDTDAVIDDATAKFYAQIFNKTGQMPQLGYGKAAAQNRSKIAQFAMQDASANSMTPDDIVANRVDFAANRAGATTAARQQAGIDRAVIEAQNTFPLAEQASAAVPRGQWVPINKATLAIKSGTSDPAMAAFVVANQGAVNAYAAAMGRGSPVTTVHAQQHAEELLSTAQSHQAYVAALHQMQKEMAAARAAPAQVRQDIRGQITGQTGAGQTPAEAAGVSSGFTGRTAINRQTGQRIRETTDGNWVQ